MNVAILRGQLSSPPRIQELASTDRLVSLEVTTRGEDGKAASVPVAWFPKRKTRVPKWRGNEEIVVVGLVRRRFFRTAAGATASRTEVVATEVVLADRTDVVAQVVDAALASLEPLVKAGDA